MGNLIKYTKNGALAVVKFILILFSIICIEINTIYSQHLFHQDVFYGGVTSVGWSGGTGGGGTGTITLTIPHGSTIRNAWLFMYRLGEVNPAYFTLNNIPFYHNDFTVLNKVFHNMGNTEIVYRDFKQELTTGTNTFDVEIFPIQQEVGPLELNWQWCMPVIYVEYENPSMDKVSTSLWYNDQDYLGLENYSFTQLNPMSTNHPVGLSLMVDRACGSNSGMDRTLVKVNGHEITPPLTLMGIGGNNSNSMQDCAGVRGHFTYENNTLTGHDNAIPNDSMGTNDALAKINNYINHLDNGYELELKHRKWPNPGFTFPNITTIFPHAYATPCGVTNAAVAYADTTICKGDSINLSASGGISYQWLGENIVAENTANPLVFPDSTQLYVVRVEHEPGCFSTKHVLVKVIYPANITEVKLENSICGEESGYIRVFASGANPFISSIGQGNQNLAEFTNLSSGVYTVTLEDVNGCVADTTVVIADEIIVQADFIADPPAGPEPLNVLLNNTSTNATDYEWFINNSFWDNSFNSSAFFDSSGVYDVMLVAYNNEPHCADTVMVKIYVKDTLVAQIPNIFTPNNDNQNDFFSITVRGGTSLEGTVTNRWGNPMTTVSKNFSKSTQKLEIWDGKDKENPATEGVYFYQFIIKDVNNEPHTFQGFVHLNR